MLTTVVLNNTCISYSYIVKIIFKVFHCMMEHCIHKKSCDLPIKKEKLRISSFLTDKLIEIYPHNLIFVFLIISIFLSMLVPVIKYINTFFVRYILSLSI